MTVNGQNTNREQPVTVRKLIISSLAEELGGVEVCDFTNVPNCEPELVAPRNIGIVLDALRRAGWSVEDTSINTALMDTDAMWDALLETTASRVYDGQIARTYVSTGGVVGVTIFLPLAKSSRNRKRRR